MTGCMNTTASVKAFGGNPRLGQGNPCGKGGRAFGTPNPSQVKRHPVARLGSFSLKGWQHEREQRLARICRCIDRGRGQGKAIHKMLIKHAWRWKARTYKADTGRRIRFGYGTLRRCYYRWMRDGRTAAAVALRYGSANRKLPADQVLELARLCATPGVASFAAAWRQLRKPTATRSAFSHAMPPRVRKELAALCAARRRVEYLERRSHRAIDKFAASLPQIRIACEFPDSAK